MSAIIAASRYHDFSYGHRVAGHENKCAHLHGHNGRVHFTVRARMGRPDVDNLGRVLDFSALKARLCDWVEREWDHRFLMWQEDPWLHGLGLNLAAGFNLHQAGIVIVPFNPTAENMARHLLEVVGPQVLPHDLLLTKVRLEETRKCCATATFDLP